VAQIALGAQVLQEEAIQLALAEGTGVAQALMQRQRCGGLQAIEAVLHHMHQLVMQHAGPQRRLGAQRRAQAEAVEAHVVGGQLARSAAVLLLHQLHAEAAQLLQGWRQRISSGTGRERCQRSEQWQRQQCACTPHPAPGRRRIPEPDDERQREPEESLRIVAPGT